MRASDTRGGSMTTPAGMCAAPRTGELGKMTAATKRAAAVADLLQAASAVLGADRAEQLRDALAVRGAQLSTVTESIRASEADVGRAKVQAPGFQGSPGPASVAAWRACRQRIESLEERLEAWAWVAPPDHGSGSGGALDGYVVGIKDVLDVAGMPTRAGSPLTPSAPADSDAPAVANLRRAGAAIAGKTQCTEWALNDPAPTRNPWDARRTPGGSSAGSAVAVATGMCTATVDTQTAGDVLRPAAYNGVTGFKPTIGWVTTSGSRPVAPTIDTIGITARRVADAAAVAAAVGDPAQFGCDTAARPRVGVLTTPFTEDAGQAVQAGLAHVARLLADAGADVAEVPCPVDLSLVHAAHRIITFAECAAVHLAERDGPAGYGPRARELIDLGTITPAHAYVHAQRVRDEATRQLEAIFADAEVIVLPVVPEPAPDRSTTGDSRYQIPWTMGGFPALSLPAGISDGGLPLAVQFVADRHRDRTLLAVARWSEQVLGPELSPPSDRP